MTEKKKKTPMTRIQINQKYEHKTYDKILVRLRKDTEPTRETVNRIAELDNTSVNAFIIAAVIEKAKRDGVYERAQARSENDIASDK